MKRAKVDVYESVRFEELRPWEGSVMKKDLFLPFKIELDFESQYTDNDEFTVDESGLYEYHPLTDGYCFKIPKGGMIPPNCKLLVGMDSFSVHCKQGACDLIIGEPDFSGHLKGRRGSLYMEKGMMFWMKRGPFDYVWSGVNNGDESCIFNIVPRDVNHDINLADYIKQMHLEEENVTQYNSTFCSDSLLSIDQFLALDYTQELDDIDTDTLEIVYPMNVCRFYWLKPTIEQPSLQSLIDFVQSIMFIKYLRSITSLDLGGLVQPARLRVVKSDCYQILHDDFMEPKGLDLFICVHNEECERFAPEWQYVTEEDGDVVASLPLGSVNTLYLAYRSDGCARFIRYISKQSTFSSTLLTATYKVNE